MNDKIELANPIIFYDGVCGLCNRSVQFLIKVDKKNKFLFSPLQGEKATFLLEDKISYSYSSLVLFYKGKMYLKSKALLKIASLLGGWWNFFLIFHLVPNIFRDFFYYIISKNRYTWFGKYDVCPMPKKEDLKRFI